MKRVKRLSIETPQGIADGKTSLFNLFKTTADAHLKISLLMHAASHELKYFYIHTLSHIIVRYHALINAHSCENVISSLLRMEQKNIIQILRYA